MITFAETIQRLVWRSDHGIFTKNRFQPLDDQVFDGGAAFGGRNLCPLEDVVGKIYGCFHRAINTWICIYVKEWHDDRQDTPLGNVFAEMRIAAQPPAASPFPEEQGEFLTVVGEVGAGDEVEAALFREGEDVFLQRVDLRQGFRAGGF